MRSVAGQTTFSAYPLVTLAAALTCGVSLAHAFKLPPAPCLASGVACTVFAVVTLGRGRLSWAARLVVCGFVCAGAALAAAGTWPPAAARLRSLYERGQVASGDPLEVTGVLERAPEPAPDGLVLALRVESVRHKGREYACAGRVELFAEAAGGRARAEYEALELRRGARLRVMSPLARAERFRNPGVETFGEFLERRDADARGTIKSPLLVERLDDERVFLPLALLDAWRLELTRRVGLLFAPETAGVLKAAMLGNRYWLSRPAAERFREGGTFHVLVISGLHITFLGALAWRAAGFFARRAPWRWAASAACVWAYALAVGAESSVARAALMFTAAAGAVALGRRSGTLNALGGAALVLLAWRPPNLFDPSFQLTFLSVLAIAGLAWPLLSRLKAAGEWRPTRATPRPPACPRWFRAAGEALFWRERAWRGEQAREAHSYRLFKTPWAARLGRWRVQRLLRYACGAVVVTLCVQLLLLPLQVVYFHRLPVAAPVLNPLVGVLMVLLAAAALCALALAPLGAQLAAPFVALSDASARLMTHAVDPFAEAGLASLRVPEYAGAASLVYALYLAPPLFLMKALLRWDLFEEFRVTGFEFRVKDGAASGSPTVRDGVDDNVSLDALPHGRASVPSSELETRNSKLVRLASLASAVLLVVVVAHPLSAGRPDGRLRIDFLDVGQGDAALLTAPDGTTLLVDAGGRPRFREAGGTAAPFEPDARGIGDRVVSEFLWRRGLSRVNYAVATHAHADHVEGFADVLANFRVDAAFVARAPAGSAEFSRLAASAARARVPLYLTARGDVLRLGGVTVEVLWPPAAEQAPEGPSGNDDSVVLRVTHGRRAFLLTGDIEAGAEAALVAAGDPLHCDALKVPHHGSRTSSTPAFVSAARPALAVVSVGQDSPHGHPHPSVVERWRAGGAQVLTTGERGTITVSTDGEDLRVETFVK
ncbi:MAG TPA: ComEC/Rec2 family competence protein [Pyrinomonadaceae bacterium]|nr:ComEC/Rec2 family competence protein [Pyrinomonadaceae bacterium]